MHYRQLKYDQNILDQFISLLQDGFSSENVITSLSGKFSCVKVTRRYSAALNGFAAELPKEAVAFVSITVITT